MDAECRTRIWVKCYCGCSATRQLLECVMPAPGTRFVLNVWDSVLFAVQNSLAHRPSNMEASRGPIFALLHCSNTLQCHPTDQPFHPLALPIVWWWTDNVWNRTRFAVQSIPSGPVFIDPTLSCWPINCPRSNVVVSEFRYTLTIFFSSFFRTSFG